MAKKKEFSFKIIHQRNYVQINHVCSVPNNKKLHKTFLAKS